MPGSELPALLKQRLAGVLGERLRTDPSDCLPYGYDNSRRVAVPQAVAFAQTHDEVAAIAAACHEHGVPLVARGRGTNTTGATVPVAGGVVLSFERMAKILRISPGDRLLECEAGAINADVQLEAGKHGLFWAPDPTSLGYSAVGGNLACNAGGPRAVKYGTARDNVLGLRAVTATGRTLKTGCYTTKGVVGYDLTRLIVGSEGTLAIITEAALKLLPKSETVRTLRACYRDEASAAAAVSRLMAQPETPSALEFMDRDSVGLAQGYQRSDLPDGTGALLIVEVDGHAETIGAAVKAVSNAARGDGLLELKAANSEAESAALWTARKALSPALRKLAPNKINEDVAVPVSRMPELIAGLRALSAQHAIRIVNFGHAGNGNIHVNLLGDASDPAQKQALHACLEAAFRLVLSLEGTISGEHGVGIEKRDYVGWEIAADTLETMREVKRVFDPKGILNPGKCLPGI
jgi:D-lactate dehydrogenase (quinone)